MEFCCLKFIFSQAEDPNFKTFFGEHDPRPPKWSRTHGRALSWSGKVKEKSGNFILSGKWQPCFKHQTTVNAMFLFPWLAFLHLYACIVYPDIGETEILRTDHRMMKSTSSNAFFVWGRGVTRIFVVATCV